MSLLQYKGLLQLRSISSDWSPSITFIVQMRTLRHFMSITKKKQQLFPGLLKQDNVPERVYPKQYPTNISDPDTHIINHSRPTLLLTPRYDVPFARDLPQNELVRSQVYDKKWKSPPNSYLLKVGIVGPTNSGKSLLMNNLTHYISAVSQKSQTTTEVIKGVKSYELNTELGPKNVQLVYHDTPGLFDNKGGVISKGLKVLNEVDFVLMVIDCNKRFDSIVEATVDRLEKSKESFAKALVFNKVDLIDSKRRFKTLISEIERYAKFDKIFYTSAETSYGLADLTEYLQSMARPDKWLYPPETRTTLSHREIYEQFMKEALYGRTYQQLPHTTSIECIGIAQKVDSAPLVQFKISVNSQNQQRSVIGTKGKNLLSMINRFKVLCAKSDDEIPNVEIKVSIRSKVQQRIESTEEIILPEKYNIIEAEQEVSTLRKKAEQRMGRQ